MNNKNITINLKKLKLIAILLVAIVLIALIFKLNSSYEEKKEKQNLINKYKKALFESISCQYNCPLAFFTLNNQTQILPSHECVKECITSLESKGFSENQFEGSELLEDNLISDVAGNIDSCGNEYPVNKSDILVNNTDFIECVKNSLKELPNNYTYIN